MPFTNTSVIVLSTYPEKLKEYTPGLETLLPLQSGGKLSVNLKYKYPAEGLVAQGNPGLVIQLPLFTGGGKEAGSTQDPGAQLLSIYAGENVTPPFTGLGGTAGTNGDTCQIGSLVPIAPCPVDKVAGFGNV